MKRLLSAILIFLLKAYQKVISPLYSPSCRYYPTCSSYGVEAIGKHGPLKGGFFTLKRICSCHPWGGSGYDPVP